MRPIVFLLLAACAAAPPAPHGAPDFYLPAAECGGSPTCLNPHSAALRAAIQRPPLRAEDELDARDLAGDLEFLRAALRKEYAGWSELLQTPGFDVERLFDDRIASLRKGPARVRFGEALVPLAVELRRRHTDLHFGPQGAEPAYEADPSLRFVEDQARVDSAPDLKDCTTASADVRLHTLRAAPLARGGTVLTVSAPASLAAVELQCGGQRFTLAQRPPPAKLTDAEKNVRPVYAWRLVGETAVIRITRFKGTPEDHATLRKLAEDYPAHRAARRIVFDLRGNNGGDDSYAHAWVERAARGSWREYAEVIGASSLLPWQMWNAKVWSQLHYGGADDPKDVAAREELRRGFPKGRTYTQFNDSTVTSEAKEPYTGKVFVLVDRNTVSAGEGAAWALHRALGAPLVGERTGGYLEYGNQRILILPRTQVGWLYSTKRNYYDEPVEGLGLPADVYLDPADREAPVEALLPLLR